VTSDYERGLAVGCCVNGNETTYFRKSEEFLGHLFSSKPSCL